MCPTFTGKQEVPDNLKVDIKWFLKFAERSNGQVLLQSQPILPWVIKCDSSMKGGGAHSPTNYYGQYYPDNITSNTTNITHPEAMNLVVALRSLAPSHPE